MITEWPDPGQNLSGMSVYYPGAKVPAPNWSRPMDVKIGSWYRPVGASRWAFGYFLCTYEYLFGGTANVSAEASIMGQVGTNNTPQILTLEAPSGYQRSWGNCFLLPPHPVSTEGFGPNSLWLLPIVDERYYWQFVTATEDPISGVPNGGLDWATRMTFLAGLLGCTLQIDDVSPKYLGLNHFFTCAVSPYSAPEMLDAMAFSVGQRIVPYYGAYGPATSFAGGNWQSLGWDKAKTQRTANLSAAYNKGILQSGVKNTNYPGGSAGTPSSIVVNFRKSKNGIVFGDWALKRHSVTVSTSDAGYTGQSTPGYSYTINSTALANLDPDTGDVINEDTLQDLATQIGQDYYKSLWIQDSCVVGISQWQETGFDDYVEFNIGEQLPDGTRVSKTRIHSRPYNDTFDTMLHCDPTVWEYGDKIMGTLDGDLAANDTQTITLAGADSATPSGVTHLEVSEVMGNPLTSGTKVMALRYGNKWAVVEAASAGGQVYVGTCPTVLTAGGSGAWTISTGTVVGYVPYGITQASTPYLLAKADDDNYYVLNPDKIFYGQFSSGVTAGNSGTLTIYDGAQGSESSTGATVSAWVRSGACIAGKTYICAFTTGGYEVLNPNNQLLCRCSTITDCSSGATITAILYAGTQGSESTTGVTVSAYVRKGFIHNDTTYQLQYNSGGFEVVNPSLVIRGKPGSDINSDASGSMVVWYGTGAGTASAVTVSSIRNDTSCTVKASKFAYAEWCDSLAGWAFDIFHSS